MSTFIEFVKENVNLFTAGLLLLAIIELAINIYTNVRKKNHDKRKNTLDAYRELQRDVFDELCIKYSKKRIKEVAEHGRRKENWEDYHILGTYTAKIEHFCVGVVEDIYDWKTVYELSHGFFDMKIREWIKPLMDKKSSYYDFNPFENTMKVFEKMDRETSNRINK